MVRFILLGLAAVASSVLGADYSREIAEVESGIRTEAKASWWGFDKEDATKCLQAALDSGVRRLIIDQTGSDWIIQPVFVTRDNQEIVVGENVVLRAKRGEFTGVKDSLLTIGGRKNIVLRGEKGAKLVMNKKDYQDASKYKPAEWRHTINLLSSENVRISDLYIASSGGDGIYIGAHRKYAIPRCKDIVIENVISDDHHRQGISVICVENLLIHKSIFKNTKGAPPQAGIDFEPNNAKQTLINCVVTNCEFSGNAGNGIEHLFSGQNAQTEPFSITYRNCTSYNNNHAAAAVVMRRKKASPLRGNIAFEQCNFLGKVSVVDPGETFGVQLKDCEIKAPEKAEAAIMIGSYFNMESPPLGNVTFERVKVSGAREVLSISHKFGVPMLDSITGSIEFDGKPFDITAFSKEQMAFNARLQQLHTAPIDFEKLSNPPAASQPSAKRNQIRFRGKSAMLLKAARGEKISVELTGVPIGGRQKRSFDVILKKPNGESARIAQLEADRTPMKVEFTADAAGVYQLEADPKRDTVIYNSRHSGQAVYMGKAFQLVSPVGRLYFEVPVGAENFSILIWGGGAGEYIRRVSLRNQKGETVQTLKGFSSLRILTGKRIAGAPAEIWSVDFGGSVEDVGVQFASPLVPLIAMDPALLLRH